MSACTVPRFRPYSPRKINASAPSAECCVWDRASAKLRVIILCTEPWTPLPGTGKTTCVRPRVPNSAPAFCQRGLTSGTPAHTRVAGIPSALPSQFTDVLKPEEELEERYGLAALKRARILSFDFGRSFSSYTRRFNEADGEVVAVGQGGTTQASLAFKYRWATCGPLECDGVPVPAFEVVLSSGTNARFVVMDDTSFLSTGPCFGSTVVLLLEQTCSPGSYVSDSVPALLPLDLPPQPPLTTPAIVSPVVVAQMTACCPLLGGPAKPRCGPALRV